MLRYFKDSVIISSLVFLFMWILGNVPILQNLEMLNPIENVLNDFDLTDVVFSQIRGPQPADTNIVLVNIGSLPRDGMAALVDRLNQYEPAVIGIDAFSRRPLDPLADSLYAAALSQVKNLVMVSQGNYKESTRERMELDNTFEPDRFDTLETSNSMFAQHATMGHANLISLSRGNMKDFTTVRTFSPVIQVNDQTETAFAVKIAEIYQPASARKFLARNNLYEYINYRGNVDIVGKGQVVFSALDIGQVLDPAIELDFIKDKIVILGYMGESLNTYSYLDKFYTPLNENYVGKSTLDMYGVVIHANITSMILHEEFINELSDFWNYVLMVVITLLSTMLFAYFFHKVGYWYDAITIFTQLGIFIVILAIGLYAFEWYHLRVEINPAIIAVIIAGIFVEIYFGLIKKLFLTLKNKHVKLKRTSNETA